MKFPAFPTLIRTFYTFSNFTARLPARYKALPPATRGTVLKSMPTIPFLSSFFSTSAPSRDMSYPVQKSDDEWRAVLSKGTIPSLPFPSHTPFIPPPYVRPFELTKQPILQNNFVFCANKAPKLPS